MRTFLSNIFTRDHKFIHTYVGKKSYVFINKNSHKSKPICNLFTHVYFWAFSTLVKQQQLLAVWLKKWIKRKEKKNEREREWSHRK